MKRTLAFMLLLVLTIVSVGTNALADYDSSQNYTLSFYYWDELQKPGMDAMIELFEAAYPNIKIESTIIPWNQYWTKMQTSLPSGTGPDVFWMNTYIWDYIEADLIYDITDKVASDGVDMSKYPQGVVNMYTDSDGRYYGIPKDFDTVAICYNKAIFDELGVAYPTSEWTWDEFLKVCQDTTKDGYYGFCASSEFQSCLSGFVYANDGTISSDDLLTSTCADPKTVEALQFVHDLMYVHSVSPSGAEQSEMLKDDMFIAGLIAMVPAGSWMVSSYYESIGDDLGVVEFPTKIDKGNITNGLVYSISSLSPNADAAWEFVKFASTYEAQAATASVVIPAYEGAAQGWLDAYPTLDLTSFITAVDYAQPAMAYAKNSTECETIFNETIATIWMDESADIQAMMDECQAKIQAVLDS